MNPELKSFILQNKTDLVWLRDKGCLTNELIDLINEANGKESKK
jgi:hypothetical protein